jgi:short-subunit dehydrogenase
MPNPLLPKPTRTALVTGASSGIGEAAARALAREGYALALIARRKDRLDLLVKDIEAAGGRALAIAADLAEDEATQFAARDAIAWLGRIDLLVNNAGYSPGAAIEQVSRQDLRHIFDVNLLSALHLIGAVTPQMRAQGGGRIVNVGSVAALVPAPLAIPYAATKVGMHVATDALRLELGRFGITLSLVIPGFVDTAVFDNARSASQALREDLDNPYRQTMFDLDELAMKNLENALSPEDVAKVIVRAATARRPKPRYYTPRSTLLQKVFLGMLPARSLDAILSRVYKLPRARTQPVPPAASPTRATTPRT